VNDVELAAKWPVLGRHELACGWLRIWADLGRARRTIDAYACGLAEYLDVCERENVDPAAANRAHVAVFVRELTSRPSRRGPSIVSIDSGAGLSNATIQQRLVPVGRGKYTPGRKFGGHERGLVPRLVKLPWIPDEQQWAAILQTAADEPARNRVMLALAYDAALRRRSCASSAPRTSTRGGGRCGSRRRTPRTGWSAWSRIRRRPACCCSPILPTGRRSAGRGGRCSCRSRGATTGSP
jgi:integrase/recombinase XerD